MKKVISFVLTAAIAVGVCGGLGQGMVNVSAEAPPYEVLDGGFVVEGTVFVWYEGTDKHVVIPEGITVIGNSAFYDCISLESVVIPSSVETIGITAFSGCLSLVGITVNSDNANYSSVDGVLFDKNKMTLIRYPQGKNDDTFAILNSVTTISNSAFYGCASLESVNIPNSVTTIGQFAFSGCTSLTFIYIPESVTTFPHIIAEWPAQGYFGNPFDDDTTLIVKSGSYVHQWALKHEQPYELIYVSSFDSTQDVLSILKLIVSGEPIGLAQITIADRNGDDKLTAADALILLKQVTA